jgi:hypothetical protein
MYEIVVVVINIVKERFVDTKGEIRSRKSKIPKGKSEAVNLDAKGVIRSRKTKIPKG